MNALAKYPEVSQLHRAATVLQNVVRKVHFADTL